MNPTSAPTQALQGSPGLVPQFEQILRKDGFYANFYIAAAAPVPAAGCTVPIFVAFFPCQVISVAISWNPAGTGTAAIQVEQLPIGTAPGSGNGMLAAGAYPISGTANTPVFFGAISEINSGTTVGLNTANCTLTRGQALGIHTTGTLTSVTSITVSVFLIPLNKGSYQTT